MAPKWDTDATAKLFTNVVQLHNVKLDYKALAEAMTKDSTTEFTAQGIRCYVGRLKGWGSATTSDDSVSPESSPGEVQKTKKASKPATPRKKANSTTAKAKKRGIEEVDGEGEEVKGWQHTGPDGIVQEGDGKEKEKEKKPVVKKPRVSKKKDAAAAASVVAAAVVKEEPADDVAAAITTQLVTEETHAAAAVETKLEPQRCADSVSGLADAEVPDAVHCSVG